jgi:hypothetical protein
MGSALNPFKEVTTKPIKATAIQFDGGKENGELIAKWVRDNNENCYWVSADNPNYPAGIEHLVLTTDAGSDQVCVGDVVVFFVEEHWFTVHSFDEFNERFEVRG